MMISLVFLLMFTCLSCATVITSLGTVKIDVVGLNSSTCLIFTGEFPLNSFSWTTPVDGLPVAGQVSRECYNVTNVFAYTVGTSGSVNAVFNGVTSFSLQTFNTFNCQGAPSSSATSTCTGPLYGSNSPCVAPCTAITLPLGVNAGYTGSMSRSTFTTIINNDTTTTKPAIASINPPYILSTLALLFIMSVIMN